MFASCFGPREELEYLLLRVNPFYGDSKLLAGGEGVRRVRRRKSGNEMGRRRVRRKTRGGEVIERRRRPGSPATEGAGGGRALAAGQLPVVPEKKKNL